MGTYTDKSKPTKIIEIEVVDWGEEELARVWFQTRQISAGWNVPIGRVPEEVRDKRGFRFDFRALKTIFMDNGSTVVVGIYIRKIPKPDNIVPLFPPKV